MSVDIFPCLDFGDNACMFCLPRALSPKQVFDILESEPEMIQIVDIRTHKEFILSRIEHSSQIPVSELPRLLERSEKKLLVVLVDSDGFDAKEKVKWLGQYSNVTFLEGGYREWRSQNLPIMEKIDDEKCRLG